MSLSFICSNLSWLLCGCWFYVRNVILFECVYYIIILSLRTRHIMYITYELPKCKKKKIEKTCLQIIFVSKFIFSTLAGPLLACLFVLWSFFKYCSTITLNCTEIRRKILAVGENFWTFFEKFLKNEDEQGYNIAISSICFEEYFSILVRIG